ncbi:MAG TPA: septum formation initiator family protein [Acidimicrobiales bacterium]|nr:septum formation initiator family protein [Acidimicrobiales bacterium]
MRRAVRILLVVVALGGLLFLFILPGRTWLQQRSAMAGAERRLHLLDQENAALARRAAQLQDPAYVQQIAREQYGLILPNEKAYGILPPTASTTTTTTAPPSPPPAG